MLLVDVVAERRRRAEPRREPHRGRPHGRPRAARRGGRIARDDRLRRAARRRRDPDRAADAALEAARARPLDRRGGRAPSSRRASAQGHVVVLESTTYPGTTREIAASRSSSRAAASSPARTSTSPSRPSASTRAARTGRRRRRRRSSAGSPPACTERAAAALPRARSTPSHTVSTPEAAELTKLLENIFRSVNIALVNELAQLCDRMDIDVWEVVERGGDEAVRLHDASSPARASAATASRSTRST